MMRYDKISESFMFFQDVPYFATQNKLGLWSYPIVPRHRQSLKITIVEIADNLAEIAPEPQRGPGYVRDRCRYNEKHFATIIIKRKVRKAKVFVYCDNNNHYYHNFRMVLIFTPGTRINLIT